MSDSRPVGASSASTVGLASAPAQAHPSRSVTSGRSGPRAARAGSWRAEPSLPAPGRFLRRPADPSGSPRRGASGQPAHTTARPAPARGRCRRARSRAGGRAAGPPGQRPHGEADADLPRPLDHADRDDRVDADRRQRQGDRRVEAEGRSATGARPPRGPGPPRRSRRRPAAGRYRSRRTSPRTAGSTEEDLPRFARRGACPGPLRALRVGRVHCRGGASLQPIEERLRPPPPP